MSEKIKNGIFPRGSPQFLILKSSGPLVQRRHTGGYGKEGSCLVQQQNTLVKDKAFS